MRTPMELYHLWLQKDCPLRASLDFVTMQELRLLADTSHVLTSRYQTLFTETIARVIYLKVQNKSNTEIREMFT